MEDTTQSQKKDAAQGPRADESRSFASPPTLSLPKGGGAIQAIGEKFAAKMFPQLGTPLADYKGAKPLALSLTPPDGNPVSAVLKSRSSLEGMPQGSADISDRSPGRDQWTVSVNSADLAGLAPSFRSDDGANKVYRLKPEAILDLVHRISLSDLKAESSTENGLLLGS